MSKENPRHLRTALIASLVLHAGLLVVLTLNIGTAPEVQPQSPLPIPIKVQFWNPQSRPAPSPAEATAASAEQASTLAPTTPTTTASGTAAEPRVSLRYAPPRPTAQDRTDVGTSNEPQLDMANVRSGIDSVVRQAGQSQWTSGKDWCQDNPPRRMGQPCKSELITTTTHQQAAAATVSGALNAHDQRCRFTQNSPNEVSPPKSKAPTADFEPRGGLTGGSGDLLGALFWGINFVVNC